MGGCSTVCSVGCKAAVVVSRIGRTGKLVVLTVYALQGGGNT